MKERTAVAVLTVVALIGVASAQNDKDLFTAKCAMCHGADGSAATGMGKAFKIPAFQAPEVQKQSDQDLAAIVTKGKSKMPAFESKLSKDQIAQLVTYVRQLGKK